MSQPRLVLASGSPRRRQLLEEAGYEFRVVAARDGVEEAGLCSGCGPLELVIDLATRKLNDVVLQLTDSQPGESSDGQLPTTLVLAADTVAECEGQILGKPRNDDHARDMMRSLSGKPHRVYTGVALARIEGSSATSVFAEAQITTLRMNELSPEWIEDYVESGAWEGKAGGFGYQDGLGFVQVTEGSESNVVGLPMEFLNEKLAALGCIPSPTGEP